MPGAVLVFVERREGGICRASLEACAVAARLAARLGDGAAAVALGPDAARCAPDLAAQGIGRLFVAEQAHLELYAAQGYSAAVAEAVSASRARLVLVAGTAMGRDVAPRVAARLGAACASDLSAIEAEDDGTIRATRPVYSGKARARLRLPAQQPCVASLRPKLFPLGPASEPVPIEVEPLRSPLAPEELGARTTRLEQPERRELDVSEASIVVSGGRGLKAAENFGLVRELAAALGGAVGASRAVVDAGWIEHAHQVGQTGKVVTPELYIACGISGAVQHLAGMSSAKTIVAINKDPDAPIFRIADYGVVGDLFEIVPALTAAIERFKRGGSEPGAG